MAALAIAACGGGGSSSSSSSAGGGGEAGGSKPAAASLPELTVALATNQSDILTYIAEAEGYFEEEGVPVKVLSETGATTASLVASGHADLAGFAVTGPLALAAQGQHPSIVYSLTGDGVGGSMLSDSENGISSLEDLKNADNCKIAAFPPGTTSYGWAKLYNEELELGCEITQLPEVDAQNAALKAGSVQAVVGGFAQLQPLEKEGGTFLINTTIPSETEKYNQPDPIEVGYWGMAEKLEEKKESVSAFVSALNKAREYVAGHDAKETAELLHSVPAYAGISAQVLEESVVPSFESYLPRSGKNGFISETEWNQELKLLAQMEVPGFGSATNPAYAYGEIIDMSYLEAAKNGAKG